MAKDRKNKGKKIEFYAYLTIKLALDVIVAWYVFDYYIANNKVMLYCLIGGYLLTRVIFEIKGLKRRKLKREFKEMFPED